MRYDPDHRSDDVVDVRGRSSGPNAQGLYLLFRIASLFGWKGIVAAVVLVGGYAVWSGLSTPTSIGPVADDDLAFVGSVLDHVQGTWDRRVEGYRPTKVVVFREVTRTGCGFGQSATGPFYCPADGQVYLDLSFFDALARLGGPGDFAQAYVVAHEVAHHLQHLLGTDAHLGSDREGAYSAGVRFELQADCFAGVWAAEAEAAGLLEVGDLEEALAAATAIGDDRLQRLQTSTVAPDSFTHGSGDQRSRWFTAGYRARSLQACDTFAATEL